MRAIDEIWIIKSGGLTIFNLSKDANIDPLLVGGFFSAIETIAAQLGEKKLKVILLGNSKITIYHGRDGLLFISRSSRKVKDKTIQKYLKIVETKFFERYGNILKEEISNSDLFKDFGNVIDAIFEDTPRKRAEKALW
ncbi:MAG: hypothetical protein ACTSYB_12915 [Candidatus Helarchaeota archaeon]